MVEGFFETQCNIKIIGLIMLSLLSKYFQYLSST